MCRMTTTILPQAGDPETEIEGVPSVTAVLPFSMLDDLTHAVDSVVVENGWGRWFR